MLYNNSPYGEPYGEFVLVSLFLDKFRYKKNTLEMVSVNEFNILDVIIYQKDFVDKY